MELIREVITPILVVIALVINLVGFIIQNELEHRLLMREREVFETKIRNIKGSSKTFPPIEKK